MLSTNLLLALTVAVTAIIFVFMRPNTEVPLAVSYLLAAFVVGVSILGVRLVRWLRRRYFSGDGL